MMRQESDPSTASQTTVKFRKRRRPALACLPCYSRKLRCARQHPICERCAKTGQECIYREILPQRRPNDRQNKPNLPEKERRPLSEAGSGSGSQVVEPHSGDRGGNHWILTPASSGLDHKEQLQHSRSPATRSLHAQEVAVWKEKDVYSQFYGYSYLRNSYQQFDGLRSYIKQLKAQNPYLNRLRDDIQAAKTQRENVTNRSSSTSFIKDSDLRNLIPVKSIADELLEIYVTRFETTYRVLHLPTLRKEYDEFWEGSAPPTVPTASAVRLLLVLAAAFSLRELCPNKTVFGGTAVSRDTARKWIEACDSWLSIAASRGQSSQSWTLLSLTTLSIIARHANQIRRSEFWTSTGALLRQAMAAGYHRETQHATMKVSPFHREMRRRLWATIVELDLQACVERGMPPSLRREDFNTVAPLHINDEALREDMREPPSPLPLDSLSATSFQTTLYRSLDVRLRVCALVNTSTVETDISNILTLDQEIMQSIRSIPSTWDDEPTIEKDGHHRGNSLYLRTVLDMCLRHQLILLHMPFAKMASHDPKFGHSRRARLEAATYILSEFRRLVETGTVPASRCRNEVIQAALTICHELYLGDGGFGFPSITATTPSLAESFLSMSERVLPMIQSGVSVHGKGRNEYYILAMVLGLVKSKLWPDRAALCGAEAVGRMSNVEAGACLMQKVDNGVYVGGREQGQTGSGVDAPTTTTTTTTTATETDLGGITSETRNGEVTVFEDLDFLRDDLDADIFGMWNTDDMFSLDHEGINEGSGGFL